MLKLSGKSVYKGIALEPAVVLRKKEQQVKRMRITDEESEIARLEKAGVESVRQLQRLYEKAKEGSGGIQCSHF